MLTCMSFRLHVHDLGFRDCIDPCGLGGNSDYGVSVYVREGEEEEEEEGTRRKFLVPRASSGRTSSCSQPNTRWAKRYGKDCNGNCHGTNRIFFCNEFACPKTGSTRIR